MISQGEIVQRIRSGDHDPIDWVPLRDGVEVMADALRIDGVMVPVSARTMQLAADALGATLPTVDVCDLRWEMAQDRRVLPPQPWDGGVWDNVLRFSAAAGPQRRTLTADTGKAWVIHPRCSDSTAVNYGLRKADGSVWQTPGGAHGLDHWDYSQTLVLCRGLDVGRHPGVEPPTAEGHLTLGQRCVEVALSEMERENPPSASTVAEYHSVSVRDGRRLGLTTGDHCASAVSWCAEIARIEGEHVPHEPRCSGIELQEDARAAGAWHDASDGTPAVGDVLIYHRGAPGGWQRHASRVLGVDGTRIRTIGANEGPGGAWVVRWRSMTDPTWLGWIEYPQPRRLSMSDTLRARVRGIIALTAQEMYDRSLSTGHVGRHEGAGCREGQAP